ncbi:MAG: single-stranded-DNA-specific exonuclease RecJ [Myxococcales bacterium]|nr:single-stranded-DNA-specific exonuclease RecJ [Myxococcales bacterium]
MPTHPLVARVLVARGFSNPSEVQHFLSPKLADLTRPDGMADRELAADRLVRALRRGERIVVFGDYDVDGLTSASLLTRALWALGGDVTPMVASRFDGGYGLSDPALDRVLAARPGVLVTLDCGTSDHPRLERARAAGVDTIVIDHHKVPETPLPAMAFLNPHRPGCGFAFKHLASVGLAFSMAAAVRTRLGVALDLKPFLDVVALGTVADVAPLRGDNRILVHAGLARMADNLASPGVRAVLREARLRHRMTARDIGFSVAPMLNAPGRLGAATPTLDLLLARDDEAASGFAAALSAANVKRREISAALVTRAAAQVEAVYGRDLPAGVVLGDEGWHHGMGGIVAARLVERLGVAVAVVAFEGSRGVGSVRAPKGVKLYDAVARCADVLEGFGGHDGAAGLRVDRSRLDALRAAFASAMGQAERVEVQGARAETALTEDDLAGGLSAELGRLDPTGEGNPDPMVLLTDARVADLRPVGEGHLRMSFGLGRRFVSAFVRDGVALQRSDRLPSQGSVVRVEGRLRPDAWGGAEAVQLDDLRFL